MAKLTKEEGRQTFEFSDIIDSTIKGTLNIQCSGGYENNNWNSSEEKIANVDGYIKMLIGKQTTTPAAEDGYYKHLHGRLGNIYAQKGKSNPLRYEELRYSKNNDGAQVANPICPTVFWLNKSKVSGQEGTYTIVKDSIWNIYQYFCGNVGEVFMDLALVFGQLAVESMDTSVGSDGSLKLGQLYDQRRAFRRADKAGDSIMGFGQVSLSTAMDAASYIRTLTNDSTSAYHNVGINSMYAYLFTALSNMYGYGAKEMLSLYGSKSDADKAKCREMHLALMEFDAGYNAVCHLGSLLTKLRDTLSSSQSATIVKNAGLAQSNYKSTPAKNAYYAGENGIISKDMIIDVFMRYHGENLGYTNNGLAISIPDSYTVKNSKGEDVVIPYNYTKSKIGLQYVDMIGKSALKLYNINLLASNDVTTESGTMTEDVLANDKINFPRMVYLFGRRVGTENDTINNNPGKSRAGRFCGVKIRWNVPTKTDYDFAPYIYRALLGKKIAEGSKAETGDTTGGGIPTTIQEYRAQSNEQKSAILNSLATSVANTKILQYQAWLTKNENIFVNTTALDFMSSISSVNLAGIIGLPIRYSKLSDLDTRDYYDITNPDDNYSKKANIYGRNYAESTVYYGNMVSLTPCRPKFMGNNDGKTVASLLSSLAPTGKDGTITADDQAKLNASMQESLKKMDENASANTGPTLFTAVPAGEEYSRMVANALRSAAMLFNVSEADFKSMFDDNELTYVGNGALSNPFDYFSTERAHSNIFTDIYNVQTKKESTNNTDGVAKLLANMYSIVVYNSGLLESSESISNNVGPSFIDQLVNLPMSEIARDANFLMNSGGAYDDKDGMVDTLNKLSDSRNSTDATQAVKDGVGGVLGIVKSASSKMFGSIKLPKIWKGTEYSKTYNVKIKLTSPSPDYLSVFKYIMAELIRLMPLWSPQQWGYYQDTISSPFLVQVYNRGTMSIEMGMITGVEVNRNPETMGLNGLPTELDINLTITDLFPYFSMPSKESDFNMAKYYASGFLSYISTFAGVPIYRGDINSFMESKVQFFKSKVVSVGNAPGKMVNENISHWLYKINNAFR